MAKLYKAGRFIGWAWIGTNSTSVVDGDLLTIGATGTIEKVGATGKIVGIAAGAQSVAVDNETVAKAKITYISSDEYTVVEIPAVWVTVTTLAQSNVGQSFNLDTSGNVDIDTAGTWTQVTMTEFVNTATSKFKIIK